LHFKKENLQLALTYFKKALQLLPKVDNLDYQIVHSNIGAAYIQLKNPKKALSYINKAHKIAISMKDSVGQSICINNLATIHRDLKQTDSALYYYKQALKMVDEFSSKEEKKTILYNLSELYQKKGNAPLALDYYKKYDQLKDELFNAEKHEFIVETQEKYEATERKREIAVLKISEQKKEAKNFKLQVGIVSSTLLLIVIILAINYRNRTKKKDEEHKTKLAIISATMSGEENQRLKISQEIHDDLGGILGVCRMLFTKSKSFYLEKNKELFERIDALLLQANSRSRAISHELFSPTLKQFGLQTAIEEYITNLRYINPDLEIKFNMNDFRLDAQLELNFFRITQELFTNTIKYANASSILLKISKTQNTLNYTYQDNGKGFDFQNITKGVGLNSIEARVKSFDGTIDYTPANEGFFVKISIPLK
jgi:signal transduction histidine kinase